MGTATQPFVLVGLGEVLWDMLPDGKQLGGAPANFAYHARRLGAEGVVASAVGDDAPGTEILNQLTAWDIDARCVPVVPGHPTGRVDVRLDADGVAEYVIHEGAAWDFIPPTDALLELAGRADAVCFGSLCQRGPLSRDTIGRFLAATRSDCLRVCDINLRQSYYDSETAHRLLRISSVLKLNDEELPVVTRLLGLEGGAGETGAARAILDRYGLRVVALTRGARGSRLITADQVSDRPAEAVDVVDTVGAGDAFTAAMTLGLLRGRTLDALHESAGRLAAFVCTQKGATPDVPEAVLAAARGDYDAATAPPTTVPFQGVRCNQ